MNVSIAYLVSFAINTHSNVQLVCLGIDPDSVSHYKDGKYQGSRFTDGSAVIVQDDGTVTQYLGTFATE